ncbi:hypothetical protein PGT21_021618 [Puccinia graminis f. sp. tritici]|uniref:Small ribosomal subunit protein uS17 N-terminal domain-containing protein n=1 Tax=Puccinia graminis f. sp. tritici TaxID=56615 RepID=A0A5B0R2T3_PUCGR|nr:hypothetical protein PGT21_021618 [Puccinia graminis f. sp. tritici]
MATTISAEQTEKAFQKQPIFQNSKIKSAGKKVASKDRRWYKDVGLGFKVSEIQQLSTESNRCISIMETRIPQKLRMNHTSRLLKPAGREIYTRCLYDC